MKTTIDMSDGLYRIVRTLAAKEGTTMKSLVEEGLHKVVEERRGRKRFKLREATFRGKGLQSGIREGSWEQIRDLIYEGRGG